MCVLYAMLLYWRERSFSDDWRGLHSVRSVSKNPCWLPPEVDFVGWISGCQCSSNINGISLSEWRDKFKCESWVVKDNLEMLWVAVFETDAVVQIFQMSEFRFLPNPMTWDVVGILFKLRWLLSAIESEWVQNMWEKVNGMKYCEVLKLFWLKLDL